MTSTLSKTQSSAKFSRRKPGCSAAAKGTVRTLRVGLLGLGTVGQGFCRLIADQGKSLCRRHGVDIAIHSVLVKNPGRQRQVTPTGAFITENRAAFLARDHDLVIEALGGLEPAGTLITHFLDRAIPVVTANKALLAERGHALLALARRNGTSLRYEASVAAGIPILGVIEHALQTTQMRGISAILNGTSNFILTRLAAGDATLSKAICEAQFLGYAEANPTLDLTGMDAAQKLSILAGTLGRNLPVPGIEVRSLHEVSPEDCARAKAFNHVLKPLALADFSGDLALGFVGPGLVDKHHPLASVQEVNNGVLLEGGPLGALFLAGPGAGALPTAASLLDDVIALAGKGKSTAASSWAGEGDEKPDRSIECHGREKPRLAGQWFLSLTLAQKGRLVEDLLELVASTGLIFRELRELEEGRCVTLAGITARASHERIQTLRTRLDAVRAVERFRAFRVAARTGQEVTS